MSMNFNFNLYLETEFLQKYIFKCKLLLCKTKVARELRKCAVTTVKGIETAKKHHFPVKKEGFPAINPEYIKSNAASRVDQSSISPVSLNRVDQHKITRKRV